MRLEVWSDIACPWCFVGKRWFEQALGAFEHRDEVEVTFRSFQLDPDAPAERRGDHTEGLARKYGISVEQAEAAHEQLRTLGATAGVTFDFKALRAANTFDAHRVTHLGKAHGRQREVVDRLMRAYFEEGALVSDHATLTGLAAEAGVPAEAAAGALASGAFADDVRADEHLARRMSMRGVPFFVANRQAGLSGAQPPEAMLQLLHEARKRARAA